MLLVFLISLAGYELWAQTSDAKKKKVLNAGFVGVENIYSNDFLWPYDVLQHTYSPRATEYINTFIVTSDGLEFSTHEGMKIIPHYSFKDAPHIDILVISSTWQSMNEDLENEELISWIKKTEEQATYVMALGKGVFLLAQTGALNGRNATTFPAVRKRFGEMFPDVKVRYSTMFVVDGKYITAVGSYAAHEPALYLVEKLYSRRMARRIAGGLAMSWDLEEVPHIIVGWK
jgi:transcriptional regulator GlxA family with amidase domain